MKHLAWPTLTYLLLCAVSAFASTVDWTTWTAHPTSTTVNGTLTVGATPVSVTYTGEVSFAQLNGTGTNFYLPLSTFTASPTVTNAPAFDMIAIDGTATTHMVTFGAPVLDPVMALVSLGQPGIGTQYTFSLGATQSMSILVQGPSNAYGGCATCLTLSGSTLTGHEGDGLIQFTGTYSSLSWTGANPEYWNGFTFGVAGLGSSSSVPEPATGALLFLGLGALSMAWRRGRRRPN